MRLFEFNKWKFTKRLMCIIISQVDIIASSLLMFHHYLFLLHHLYVYCNIFINVSSQFIFIASFYRCVILVSYRVSDTNRYIHFKLLFDLSTGHIETHKLILLHVF
jgi:hypothetical protein